jgi:hypothetical protein
MTSGSEEHTGLTCKVEERLEKYAFTRKKKGIKISKTLGSFYQTTRSHVLEGNIFTIVT